MTAAVCKSSPSAAWDLHRLLSSLQAHGWGELDGPSNAGLQKVMTALCSLLPWESAEGQLTRAQVADAAGMTPKWAGHCLRRLEALALITWRRGWLDHGQPRAGWIRVQKSRLAAMVRSVRGYLDERRARRKAETHQRLAAFRTPAPTWRLRRNPLSSRGELSAHLPTQGSTGPRPSAFQQPSQTLPFDQGDAMAACATCGRAEDACRLANDKVGVALRHDYQPGRPLRPTVVAGAHELCPSPQRTHLRGWRERVAELRRPAPDQLPLDGGKQ